MGFRNAVLVSMAIPFSMFLSFIVLNIMGITLNVVVLFSLTLALGMLVDNAIVIVENIYRYMEQGAPRLEAAKRASSEVAYPVIGSTLTTLAAASLPGTQRTTLPLVGRVAAGSPVLAQENIEDELRLDPKLFSPRPHYLLRVEGMSMRDAGVLDGDLLAVHRTPEARNGQVVVARIDDGVTQLSFPDPAIPGTIVKMARDDD